MPAVTKDSMGRHPLHWACANPQDGKKVRSNPVKNFRQNVIKVDNMLNEIAILIQAYPEAVIIPDSGGMTPLDIAQVNGADPRIIDILQRASKMCQESRWIQVLGEKNMPKRMEEKSNGENSLTVESLSEEELIVEVSETGLNNDISSIGSAGISIHTKRQKYVSPWSFRVDKIENAIEM